MKTISKEKLALIKVFSFIKNFDNLPAFYNYKKLSNEQKRAINSNATHYIALPSDNNIEAVVNVLMSLGFDGFESHPELNIMSMFDN